MNQGAAILRNAVLHAESLPELTPSPRWGHASFVHGDKIFIFGGTDGVRDKYDQ